MPDDFTHSAGERPRVFEVSVGLKMSPPLNVSYESNIQV